MATTIHERFTAQAHLTPGAVAVSAPGTTWTYRRLDERTDRLAHRLTQAGARPGEPVAILADRTPHVIAAILATLKTGAFALPLHSANPPALTQQIMDRCGSPPLLTDPAMTARGLPRTRQTLDVTAALPPAPHPHSAADRDGDGEDLAYVIHTSGSTGEPKGVAVPHRAILHLADDPCWSTGAHQRILALAPYAFGVSAYELWVPLLRGGQIVLPPPGDLGVRTVRQLITAHAITALHVTAGLFRLFAEEAPDSFATVREVLTGGDVISPEAVRRVLAACPATTVRAMYGATEVSSFAAHAPLTADRPPTGPIPVGRPLDTVGARLLDTGLNPVADGTTGELYLAGPRLAHGYHQRPDLTAQRFITHPDGTRLYRTGDLMRHGPGGLEFAGRADDQIKIRGYRVEPAQTEHVLSRQPGIAHAAVIAREAPDGDKHLIAYLVPRHAAIDLPALKAATAAALPDYQRPAAYVELPALPLTANGKLDHAALPDPDPGTRAEARGTQADRPRTAHQDALCALFSRVLGIPGIGLDDSFFTLGGQSLQAMRLASRIEAELGHTVSVADILNHPTVAELDAHLQQTTTATADDPAPAPH
ncbi:non-ribosomal peptide synthetase [Streptomyces sp. NPDC057638]|uniref:non-ribosomal peptide synthetase n=1 Tax=Streptomyces sp. NPDC057638 TaxID=3346190 RepID=UPI0036B4A61F